jgi:C-terminal processing protease CtpA/Prc
MKGRTALGRWLRAALCAGGLTPATAAAQEEPAARAAAFAFESTDGAMPGWNHTAGVSLDSVVVHGGRYAGRLHLEVASPTAVAILSLSLPRTFTGDTIELRGWLKTEDVGGFAGLWLREDGRQGPVRFDNMQGRGLSGTTDWAPYSIRLPLDDRARTIFVGALATGGGTVWVDDVELLIDGMPPEAAPPFVPPPNPVTSDTAFDRGSGIGKVALSGTQVESLQRLGRVWGFVKYHHPRVTGGEVNWDYELFRVLPSILAAEDRATVERSLTEWLTAMGEVGACYPCARPPADAHLVPEHAWIRDRDVVGDALGALLARIHAARPASGEQYYVGLTEVGNPDFGQEAAYGEPVAPDAGYRLLALYRFWNIVAYWFPYRDLLEDDWAGVLTEFIPRVMAAETAAAYRLVMLQLIARVHDTHANLWSDLALRPPQGRAQLPVVTRFVEGKAVVTGYSHDTLGPASGLRIGDVIETLDGAPVDSLVRAWAPYYADSNEAARLRDVARMLTRGPERPVQVQGERAEGPFALTAGRAPVRELDVAAGRTHDLPGDAFQRLTDEVAYLKLSAVKSAEAADYVRRASGAKVLVIDIRNYPSEFMVFALGGHLVSTPTEFARFTHADPANPGAFVWTPPLSIQPVEPHFEGKVVILVDEVSQSQAEYTTMAFRAAPGAIVVGSTTAGADGNVSPIALPGGLSTMISGIGVFYPDRTPTQRVGIVPDVVVRPTIAGIRAGRDEVLEEGVTRALGKPFRWSPPRAGGR